jgi:hypothetical protein
MARQNNVICTQLSKDSGLIKAIVAIDSWQNQILTPFATRQNDDFFRYWGYSSWILVK